jgi:3-keto-disaccharide hydrolase
MNPTSLTLLRNVLCAAVLAATSTADFAADNPFIGHWALTIPGGGAGWLGLKESDGQLKGEILWGGGSVVPVNSARVEGSTLVIQRIYESKPKDASGKTVAVRETETIKATLEGDALKLTTEREKEGNVSGKASFSGKRIAPVPPAPDISKLKFGKAIELFNGKDLNGWKVMGAPSGWRAENGVLVNDAQQKEGEHKSYANIRTEREFEDFNLTLETRVPKNGNSGIYLRGIYEVQVADSHGKGKDSHNMGGIYSRVTPTENAARPAGEWQTYDITLANRHVTVILNGKKIIDNQPLLGCTGGALWSDEFRPGPIYLQGDHTSVDYRNIVLRPITK